LFILTLFCKQRENACSGFLDRPTSHIDDRPSLAGAELATGGNLFRNSGPVDIIRRPVVGTEPEYAVLADLDDAVCAGART
jgi:hypothetical protein